MKKRLTFITLLMLFCSTMFGQSHWGNPVGTDMSMTMYGNIFLNGEKVTRDNVEIGAFCNGELRGYASPVADADYMYVLDIAGRKNNEAIEFRLYDPEYEGSVELLDDIKLDHVVTFRNGDGFSMDINFTPSYWNKYELLPVIETSDMTMAVIAYIYIDGEYQNRNDIELAAYCGEELRSVTRPILNKSTQQYIANFNIYGHDDDEITFKLYDHSGNILSELLPLSTDYPTVVFVNNGIIGRPTPITLNFIYPSVAKIGDVYYTTLAEAVEAATEGNNTITLLRNAKGNGIVINKSLTINFAGFAYTLNEDEVISIQEGGVATFVNDANITEGVELFGGQLYTTNDDLTIVAKKTVVGSTTGWGTLSSPTAKGIAVFSTSTGHDFYQYVESAPEEWNYIGGDFNSYKMDNGRGYLYANTDDTEVSFEGTLNYQDVNYSLSYTQKDLAGFHLIGNPFTHNISKANLSGVTLAEGYYTLSNQGEWQAVNDGNVAPMQGVLVQATTAGKLTIQKTAPATQTREASNGALEIVVANTDYSDVAYVSFNDGVGLEKIGHQNASAPLVYVTAESKKFAIATMKQDVNEIPVSFVAKTMGQYTISVEAVDCEFNEMYLTDRMTGEKVNLLLEDYTFVATSNDNADRFIISFGTTKPESVAENFIYINNGNMIINNIEGNAVVRVLDVLGRPVAEYNVTESANISTATLSSGVYMIQMYDNNGVKVQKIVVE